MSSTPSIGILGFGYSLLRVRQVRLRSIHCYPLNVKDCRRAMLLVMLSGTRNTRVGAEGKAWMVR